MMHIDISLAILNAKIWTANPKQPYAEAIAVCNGYIHDIGTNQQIKAQITKKTKVIDASGKLIVPGFIDSHLHLIEGGIRLNSLQLRDVQTKGEFISAIANFAKTCKAGEWIIGGDWDHENWGGELPCRHWIDALTPENPVWISRLDGHMALANTATLTASKFSLDLACSEGEIEIDEQGKASGIFKDRAMDIIARHIPKRSKEQTYKDLEAAMKYLNSLGVTSVHNLSLYEKSDIESLDKARKDKKLTTRIYTTFPLFAWRELHERIKKQGTGDKWLKVGGVKGFTDGSLGASTAAFFDPYKGSETNRGMMISKPEELFKNVLEADKHNIQVMIHAIGDKANNTLLNIYERVIESNGKKDRRFRIEHAQHLLKEDIPRFAKLNVLVSAQPYHLIDDGRWAEKLIGAERLQTSFAFKSLLKNNAHVSFGSDWFVALPNPILGIYAAVTRKIKGEKSKSFVPEERITVEQALKAYTIDAAYAGFDEKIKGSLEKGKLADMVVLDKDILTIEPEEIQNTKVEMTILDGKIL